MDVLPLRSGDTGDGVRDLQQRLTALGLDLSVESQGAFGLGTERAVFDFQTRRGLPRSGVCDQATWRSLVEAGYRLGDRLLYLRSPMVRGDDVAQLQQQLGTLGFDAGRVDGIFGPDTDRAVRDFQRNAALSVDGVAGPALTDSLAKLGHSPGRATNVAGVRERERLLGRSPRMDGCRIVIGESGGLSVLVHATARLLRAEGAVLASLHHPHPSVQAIEANDFGADLYVGLTLVDDELSTAAYYSTTGFESVGGRRLAELLLDRIQTVDGITAGEALGQVNPILRETRMPSVVCSLGPPDAVVAATATLADALHQAIRAWVAEPVDPSL